VSIDLQSYSRLITAFTEYCTETKLGMYLNLTENVRESMPYFFLTFYAVEQIFYKKGNFLQICIFKGFDQF
jgi:hypothetical protein